MSNPYRDQLEAAYARIEQLETELAEVGQQLKQRSQSERKMDPIREKFVRSMSNHIDLWDKLFGSVKENEYLITPPQTSLDLAIRETLGAVPGIQGVFVLSCDGRTNVISVINQHSICQTHEIMMVEEHLEKLCPDQNFHFKIIASQGRALDRLVPPLARQVVLTKQEK